MGVLEKWKWRDQNVVNPDAPKSQVAMAGIARSASAVSDAVSEELSAKLSSAKAAAASVGAKSYTVEPEGAYMVHPQAGLVPGSLYMSDKNLTFKSQVGAGEINAKIPLAGIMHLTEPEPKELASNAPLYASLCGGAPMATFRVTFVQTKSKMTRLATLGKDKGSGETTAVDYIVTADRAAELHGALEPFVGKDVVNKKGGLMGELSSKLSGGATPTGPAGGPGAAPSADTPPPPPGWELRDSTQYPGRQFYSHAATGKTSWTHPGAAEVAPAPAPPMPWDGQEITLTQPAEGGLGMNIDARCEINSVKPGSVSEVGGVKVGTTIVRMNGRRVKDRKDIVKIVKSLKPGDKVELLMHTPEQTQAMVASQVKVAVQHSARQEDGAEPEPEAPRPRFQSKYRKIERSGSAPGDALMAAAKGGSFKGSANAVLAVARTSQLARSQVSAVTPLTFLLCVFSPDVLLQGVIKTGWLQKRSGGHKDAKKKKSTGQYKRRFFAITGGASPKMEYYKDQQEFRSRKAPKGVIPLSNAKAEMDAAEGKSTKLPSSFVVHCGVSHQH